MLILTRKTDDKVLIQTPAGDEILITVTRVGDRKVQLGFKAPREITIVREEVANGD